MNTLISSWDFDDTTEWLRPVDLFLAIELLKSVDSGSRQACIAEIGVWKGAWLLQLTGSQPGVLGVGIDPYPGSPDLRQRVLDRAASKGLADRIVLVPTATDVCGGVCAEGSHRQFSVVHIDGLHVEEQVTQDLRYAANHCAPSGVIIVDDYLHPAYPGIASAMYRFLADQQFAMFLATPNKAYLCRADSHAILHAATERLLDESGLIWVRHSGEHAGPRYVQRPDVMGFAVLLCLDVRNDRLVLNGLHQPRNYRVHRLVDRWVPQGLRDCLRPVKKGASRVVARLPR